MKKIFLSAIVIFSLISLMSCKRTSIEDIAIENKEKIQEKRQDVKRNEYQELVLKQTFYDVQDYFSLFYTLQFYNDKKSDEIFTDNLYFKSDGNKIKAIIFKDGLGNLETGKTSYNDIINYFGPPDIIEQKETKIIYLNKDESLSLYFDGGILKFIIYNAF